MGEKFWLAASFLAALALPVAAQYPILGSGAIGTLSTVDNARVEPVTPGPIASREVEGS